MADLRELFHDAAATPTQPLDVPALLRQARRRRRRWVVWLGSLGALFAVAAPAGVQWATGGDHAKVRTLPGPLPATTTTTTVAGGSLVPTPSPSDGRDPGLGRCDAVVRL